MEHRADLEALVAMYDRPLTELFRSFCVGHDDQAADWKQDFVLSHLLSGKVFAHAKPGHSFRKFLAVAAKNFVSNKLEGSLSRTPNHAKPFSQFESAPGDRATNSSHSVADACDTLTRARAWDVFHSALDAVAAWAVDQPDHSELKELIQKVRHSDEAAVPASASRLRLFAKLRDEVKRRIRDEVLVMLGTNPDEVIGREVAIFMKAIRRDEA